MMKKDKYPRLRLIPQPPTKKVNVVEINTEKLFNLAIPKPEVNPPCQMRDSGWLKNRSYWLPACHDWVIVKDNLGSLCLVPLKKM